MTNEEIIFNGTCAHLGINKEQGLALLQSGKFPVFHTYEVWKQLGYQVRKGEHSDLKLVIWKQGKPKEDQDGKPVAGRMFMKTAHFFGSGQVDKVTGEAK